MRSIDEMIQNVLKREGGFVDHPKDRGGPTNYGITIKTLSNYLGRAAMRSEIEGLPIDIAEEIYKKNYYYGPSIDSLDHSLQPFIFDCAVNHGPRRAIKFIQQVYNQAGFLPPLSEDGAMGPNTRRGVSRALEQMGDVFLEALIEERKNFYLEIVASNPSQHVFLAGWMNRVREFEEEIA